MSVKEVSSSGWPRTRRQGACDGQILSRLQVVESTRKANRSKEMRPNLPRVLMRRMWRRAYDSAILYQEIQACHRDVDTKMYLASGLFSA